MKKQLLLGFALIGISLAVHAGKEDVTKTIDVAVTKNGFEPNVIDVKPGTHVVLNVTRKVKATCANEIQVPSKNIKVALAEMGKPYRIDLGQLQKGEVKFGCGMDMMLGGLIVAK